MNAVVFEHVPLSDLPETWRCRLATQAGSLTHVTVHLEPEVDLTPQPNGFERPFDNPIFGMWRDHQDTVDVDQCLRQWRAGRFGG